MTVNRGLWVPINTGNVGTTEVEARLADDALFESSNGADARSGILNASTPTLVTGAANMSYNLAACDPVINRVAGEGVYRFSCTGTTNVATTAAPTANSRIDVIWVKQNDQSKTDANNQAVVGVTQGATAATPAVPVIPAGAMEIARATVAANITATTSASITQTFRYTALRGQPVPVRNLTERAEITSPRLGQRVARLDLHPAGIVTETWTGSAWLASMPYAEFTTSNLAPSATQWGFGAFTRDTSAGAGYESNALTDNSWAVPGTTDKIQVRDAGVYDLALLVNWFTANTSTPAPATGVSWISPDTGKVSPMAGGLTQWAFAWNNMRLGAGALITPSLSHGSGVDRSFTTRLTIVRKG